MADLLSTAAPSPRFVRPLQPAKPVPRLRPLSSQSLTNAFVPPDTPPPSSPSIAASDAGSSSESGGQLSAFRSSFDLDRQHPPIVAAVRGPKGHSRQVSRSSSIIRDVIPEDERETLSSPISYPATTLPLPPTISPIILEQRPLEVIEEPVSPIKVVEEEPRQLLEVVEEPIEVVQVEVVTHSQPAPQTFALSFAPAREATAPSKEHLAAHDELDIEDEFEEIFDLMDDEVTQTVMRNWVHFHYEAEMEIRRSQARWPDTDASREAVARKYRLTFTCVERADTLPAGFKRPTTTHDILHFLFDSQNRFHSRVHHGSATPLPNLPSPAVYPHHAVSPPTPNVSSDGSHSKDPEEPPVEVSPPSPSPIPVKKIRMPLGAKPVNRQLVLTKSTSSLKKQEPALSPFTALPPKLGLRLRSKLAAATTSPKKMVDVGFLEGKSKPVTRRRKDQFDAARRKLEGLGAADEQRSDGESESENSGVIEAKGEGSVMGFAR